MRANSREKFILSNLSVSIQFTHKRCIFNLMYLHFKFSLYCMKITVEHV